MRPGHWAEADHDRIKGKVNGNGFCDVDFHFRPAEFRHMPVTVLVAPDKFKGTLTAAQAAEAIAKGWRGVKPQDRIELLPIAYGGDGFLLVFALLSSFHVNHCHTD